MLRGPLALIIGFKDPVAIAKLTVKFAEELPTLEIKGAVLDGQLFKGQAGVKELSKYPTKEEALGQTVALLLGPAKTLAAQIKGPGANIAGLIKAIETKLEKGETIAKKA